MRQLQKKLIRLLNLIGFFPSRKGRGILFIDNKIDKFNGALVAELIKEYPRENIYHLSSGINKPYNPDVVEISKPYESSFIIQKMLSRLKISLLFLTENANVTKLFIDQARENGACVVMTSLPSRELEYINSIDYFFIQNESHIQRLHNMGVEESRISLVLDSTPQTDAKEIVRLIGKKISFNAPAANKINLRKFGVRIISSQIFRPLYNLKYQSIHTIDSLKNELGNPTCILCLGNGPSSIDSRLNYMAYDVLFRVNHLWLKQGHLSHPDMIFTGLKSTVKAYKENTIFGFQTLAREEDMLVKCLPIPRKLTYATAEAVGSVNYKELDASYQPTNGLVMLATAVALQPEKIIIAGVDLFQHPTGAYPADTTTPNAYTLAHDRDMEQAEILDVLAKFKGELVILSEILDLKWKDYLASHST
ncbi:MAG: hypothetical protein V3W04_15660 [Gammaproteobacteria bacterium]